VLFFGAAVGPLAAATAVKSSCPHSLPLHLSSLPLAHRYGQPANSSSTDYTVELSPSVPTTLSYVLSTSAPQSQAEFNAWVFDAYHAAYVSPPPFVNSDHVPLSVLCCSNLFYSLLWRSVSPTLRTYSPTTIRKQRSSCKHCSALRPLVYLVRMRHVLPIRATRAVRLSCIALVLHAPHLHAYTQCSHSPSCL
jgi:hypothetical protein